MPGPVIQVPLKYQPGSASVLDDFWTRVLRRIGTITGMDDPNQQIMGIAGAMVVPGGEAGPAAKAVQAGAQYLESKFPKLAGYIKAYHGSPHDFDKFSLDKIGTGEGAQAYGHGLYFAEHPQTAEQYKKTLGNREFKVGERNLVSPMGGSTRALDMQSRGENIAAQALDDAFNAQSSSPAQFAAGRLRSQARLYPEESQHIDEALKVIAEWQKTGEVHKMGGKMYEVSIAAHPDQFLDYDKPVSQQGDAIRAKVTAAMDALQAAGTPVAEYHELIGTPHGSAALKQAGIPGIKYLDQGSRVSGDAAKIIENYGSREKALEVANQRLQAASIVDRTYWEKVAKDLQTPETRNFVVFDDSLIDIMRKYGVVLPLGAGLAALSQQQQKAAK